VSVSPDASTVTTPAGVIECSSPVDQLAACSRPPNATPVGSITGAWTPGRAATTAPSEAPVVESTRVIVSSPA